MLPQVVKQTCCAKAAIMLLVAVYNAQRQLSAP